MYGRLDDFEFCKYEQLVSLSAFTLSQAFLPQKKTKKTFQISITSSKIPFDQVFFLAVDRYYRCPGRYYRSWEVCFVQLSRDGSADLAPAVPGTVLPGTRAVLLLLEVCFVIEFQSGSTSPIL
jgi:hypothetical protein